MRIRFGYNENGDNFVTMEDLIDMFENANGTIEIKKGEARDLALLLRRFYAEHRMMRGGASSHDRNSSTKQVSY